MIKKQTILPDSYVSPVCKTVVLGPRAHYLQTGSPNYIENAPEENLGEY